MELLLNVYGVSVWQDGEVLKMMVAMAAQGNVLNATKQNSWKTVKTVNLMLCVFYHD